MASVVDVGDKKDFSIQLGVTWTVVACYKAVEITHTAAILC